MKKFSSDSITTKFNIRLLQRKLQDHIKGLKKQVHGDSVFDVSIICDNVKEKILNYEDDIYLSKTQNDWRRIHIASELCHEISLAYGNNVDLEFKKIVFDILKVEKFQRISSKITKKKRSYLYKEKQFNEEALSKLLSYSKENEIGKTNEIEILPSYNQTESNFEIIPDSNLLEQFTTSEKMTELRNQTTDISNASINAVDLTGEATNLLLTSIKEPSNQPNGKSFVEPIPDGLDEYFVPETIPEIHQPDNTINAITTNEKTVEKAYNIEKNTQSTHLNKIMKDGNSDQLSEDDFWSFSEIEPEKKKRKKVQPLLKDHPTHIENYAARALRLNKNICIERVQVYEGPPEIIKSMSVSHMMTNSGFGLSISSDRRNSKLNLLYKRHLIVQEKTQETLPAKWKRVIGEERQADQKNMEGYEHNINIDMHSTCHCKENSSKPFTNKVQVEEDLDLTADKKTDRESVIEIPMSQIIQPLIQPNTVKNINATLPLLTSTIQQFPEKEHDSTQNGFWLYSAEKNPPSKKWKKFGYVIEKIKEFVLSSSVHDSETEISVRDLLSFAKDLTIENFLTLLRVLDKLALEKILVLKFKQSDIVITSFSYLHTTEMNSALQGTEAKS